MVTGVNKNARVITARTLLHGFLELRSLSPDLGDWSEARLSSNPPRLFRLRQLVALFRAFDIPWDPSSFVEGKFIQPESTRYAAALEKMAKELPEATSYDLRSENDQLPACFEILFSYRERVDDVLSFSSGVLAASGPYLYAHRKTGELNRIIQDNLAIIEDILVTLISPEATVFSIEQLARDYDYPDVDLFDIDAGWW